MLGGGQVAANSFLSGGSNTAANAQNSDKPLSAPASPLYNETGPNPDGSVPQSFVDELNSLAAAEDAAAARQEAILGDGNGSSSPDPTISSEPLGGAYSKIKANGWERHHMPANSISPFSKGKGPVIRMVPEDHRLTRSWGNYSSSNEYRSIQRELIEDGRFWEAQQMDIDELVELFGDKYAQGIEEMLKYTAELLIEELGGKGL